VASFVVGQGGHLTLSDFKSFPIVPGAQFLPFYHYHILLRQKHAYFIIFSENILLIIKLCTKKLLSQ